jgi:hypothetical protein
MSRSSSLGDQSKEKATTVEDLSSSGTTMSSGAGGSDIDSTESMSPWPPQSPVAAASPSTGYIAHNKLKQALSGRVVKLTRQMKMSVLHPLIENGGSPLAAIMEQTGTLISMDPRTPRSSRMRIEVRGPRENVNRAWEEILALCNDASLPHEAASSCSRPSSSECTTSSLEEFLEPGDVYFGIDTTSVSTRSMSSGSRSHEESDGDFELGSSGCASPTGSSRSRRSHTSESLGREDEYARQKCRISVGGLSPETDADELYDFFSLFGVVVDVTVCDENGTHSGFVEFADPDTATVVHKQRNLIFNNHIITVRKVKSVSHITYRKYKRVVAERKDARGHTPRVQDVK